MSDPNATPLTELQLLIDIRDEMRSRLSRIEADIALVAAEQRRLGSIVGGMVADATPVPRAVGQNENW